MNDELRVPDPGLRRRRRESGSCVLEHAAAPPPVADSYAPDALPPVQAVYPVSTPAPGSAPPSAPQDPPRSHPDGPALPTDAADPTGTARQPSAVTDDEGRSVRQTSDAAVIRSTGSMAVANLISRLTGFVRMILILAVLGPAVASAFNTANTLPNMITELVLGSVLTAMFMPLLARSAREDPDGGVSFVR